MRALPLLIIIASLACAGAAASLPRRGAALANAPPLPQPGAAAPPPWMAPDQSWSSWVRRWWQLPHRPEPLERVLVTPLLPDGTRAEAAELLLPPLQMRKEGFRPEPPPADRSPPGDYNGTDGNIWPWRKHPWYTFNSSEATPLVPAYLSWMTDATEMTLRADGGGLDIDVARAVAQLVATSYCNETNLAAWNCTRCSKRFQLRRVIFDKEWDLLGYVGYSLDLHAIVVAFRGTDSHSIYNWVENMRTWRTDLALSYPGMPPHALVHGGFFYSYNSSYLAGNITQAVAELVAEHEAGQQGGGGGGAGGGWMAGRQPLPAGREDVSSSRRRRRLRGDANERPVAPTVFVAGHSLGGALATLCALDLRLNLGLADVRVVTFGSPRVGNSVFAEWFEREVGPHWRFTHNRDIVPSVPPQYMGFTHVAKEVWLVDLFEGHTLVGVCDDSGEDPRCHNSVCHLGLCSSVGDHLMYLSPMYSPRPQRC